MKNTVIGITAHVDAGKTTLSEALLYQSGAIKELGRVDKRDAHLDTYSLERERGITIFSKQAVMTYGDTRIFLIDTPGHIDFSCETERSLSVQDYCILVVSAQDGVRPHTKTLWQLLAARRIPTVIFVNKTDIEQRTKEELLAELKTALSPACTDFSHPDTADFFDSVAGCDAELIDEYLETDTLEDSSIISAIADRKVFPCLFGSALKLKGTSALLDLIDRFTKETPYPKGLFGAKVYKISRDQSGRRMTLAKITGGSLKPKDYIEYKNKNGDTVREKIEEIRLLTHDRSKPLSEAEKGTVCALFGPTETAAGMGIGIEADDTAMLAPVLSYRLILPDGISPYDAYLKFSVLGEEDPTLGISWHSETSEIRVSLMGEIQREVLTRMISERFSITVGFDEGDILYRETIKSTVTGSGHFEPLRHYAEVHLLIEPLEEGSGIVADADCRTDVLATNWQRLILTHIEEKRHRGVLIGAPLTDVKITVIAGKAHLKHTEGGDFRQATYRAVRQGLMKAESVILEPTFNFRIELPSENLGRAMNDITAMHGTAEPPGFEGDTAILEGVCPVATMRGYPSELRAYTKGCGRITMNVGRYMPAHDQDELLANTLYNPELDERNSSSSVFCRAGAGYSVPWNEADALMHIRLDSADGEITDGGPIPERARAVKYTGTAAEDKELMRIFEATYGKIAPRRVAEKRENRAPTEEARQRRKPYKKQSEYLILDGYNVIFAWDELKAAAVGDLALARDMLIRIVCNYAAFKKCPAEIVFDAYKQKGNAGSMERCGNVSVIYTKEGETADAYIERTTHKMRDTATVRVVTSDLDEQNIILGSGGLRVSVKEFKREIETVTGEINEAIEKFKHKLK